MNQLHGQSIVAADLRAALIATAKKRGTEKYLADAPVAFDEVKADPNMKKFSYAADLSWHTAIESIHNLAVKSKERQCWELKKKVYLKITTLVPIADF